MKLNPLRWLGNIKVGPRLFISYALIMLFMIVSAVYSIISMNTIERHSSSILEDDIAKLEVTENLIGYVDDVSRSIRTDLLLRKSSPELAASEEKRIFKAQKQYDDSYQLLKQDVSAEDEDKAIIKQIDKDKIKARTLNDRLIALSDRGKNEAAMKLMAVDVREAESDWLKDLTSYADLQRQQANSKKAAIAAQTSNARRSSAMSTGVAIFFAVLFAFLISRSITGPLHSLQSSIDSVRRGGSMEALAQIDSRDEFNDMGFAVNQMLQDQISAREQAEDDKKKAEEENEALNNSVIEILQALHSLSQRDLTVRAPVSQDVIGTVSDSVNLLADETAKVLQEVTRIASQVADVSGKVREQGNLVSMTAADESKSVREMVNSLSEATSSINRVAALAEQSNISAERATQVTDTALTTVNETVVGMESIRETISETEKRIKRLGERSQEITGIVNLINTISERTHVLALNASMQAAVAGEAGRGFAVVAEEVQRLAESSRNATQQIATLVNNIQTETNETISTVNRTISQVVQGSEQAQKAGEQMRMTQEITNELVDQVRRITTASDQQKDVSVKLLEAVQRLGQSNEHTSEQIDTQSKETQSLLDSAKQLVESVRVFKLPGFAS